MMSGAVGVMSGLRVGSGGEGAPKAKEGKGVQGGEEVRDHWECLGIRTMVAMLGHIQLRSASI